MKCEVENSEILRRWIKNAHNQCEVYYNCFFTYFLNILHKRLIRILSKYYVQFRMKNWKCKIIKLKKFRGIKNLPVIPHNNYLLNYLIKRKLGWYFLLFCLFKKKYLPSNHQINYYFCWIFLLAAFTISTLANYDFPIMLRENLTDKSF